MGCCSSMQPFVAESGSKAARGALALHHGLDRAQKALETQLFHDFGSLCLLLPVTFQKDFPFRKNHHRGTMTHNH